jgi:hypothetical protein
MILGSLVLVFLGAPANSQSAEETSVSEPTQLDTAASAVDSVVVSSEMVGEIVSADSRAAISVIEVEVLHGDKIRGVKITLENSRSMDRIYITDSLLSSLRDELKALELTSPSDGKCQAKYRCVLGIERCRLSQSERQAYCPGRYSTPGSDSGFVLTTPRHSFLFPAVETAQLDAIISEAMLALD